MITSMAFQKNPDPILWCVRSDGVLLSMTYDREQNVIAWSRHPFIGADAVGVPEPPVCTDCTWPTPH